MNDEFTVSLCIARCHETAAGSRRWKIRFETSLSPDVIVALRMDRENQSVQNYYILPRINLPGPQVRMAEHNGLALDAFRFDTLDQLYEICAGSPDGSDMIRRQLALPRGHRQPVYFGRGKTILLERARIKRQTIQNRRLMHATIAAQPVQQMRHILSSLPKTPDLSQML